MEEMVMESHSEEISGSATEPGVADAWETVSAALVSRLHHRTHVAKWQETTGSELLKQNSIQISKNLMFPACGDGSYQLVHDLVLFSS